jgi:hypothetical protein
MKQRRRDGANGKQDGNLKEHLHLFVFSFLAVIVEDVNDIRSIGNRNR